MIANKFVILLFVVAVAAAAAVFVVFIMIMTVIAVAAAVVPVLAYRCTVHYTLFFYIRAILCVFNPIKSDLVVVFFMCLFANAFNVFCALFFFPLINLLLMLSISITPCTHFVYSFVNCCD